MMRTEALVVLSVLAVGCNPPPSEKKSTGKSEAAVYESSLPNSNFEIDNDANLKLDTATPAMDWATADGVLIKPDKETGSNDDAFGQGSKEDSPEPSVVDGSIPPNKSDLLNFGVYFEQNGADRFLHMFWHRVQEPNGTTNMDFEFNQSNNISGNGVTPERSYGDLLIQYDLSQGGTNPQLFLSRWITGLKGETKNDCEAANKLPCWDKKVNLTSDGDASGSINTSAILAADSNGLGDISPRTFGEASVDFSTIVGSSQCVSFGSAYLKSRSSDAFKSELKDFIAPLAVNITNCGRVKVIKVDDIGNRLAGAVFELRKDNEPMGGSPGTEDDKVQGGTTNANGEFVFPEPVLQGDYWLVETVAPAGYDLPTTPYQLVTVTADVTVEKTFVNPRQRGAILVTKTRKHAADGSGDHPHVGVPFTIKVDGEDVTKMTNENGQVCFEGLLFGAYTVTETVPNGYKGEAPKNVVVDNKASCSDDPFVGEKVSFSNMPLSDITIQFHSQIEGGTKAKISCEGLTPTPEDGDNDSEFNDTLETYVDLLPGTYTCTVVVDP